MLRFIAVLLFLLPSVATTAILNVPSQFATLQDAMDSVHYRDTIYLAPGYWSGDGFRNLTTPIYWYGWLIATGGKEQTIIDLGYEWFCRFNLHVRGVTFLNGSIVIDAPDNEVRECTFENNLIGIKTFWLDVVSTVFVDNDTAIIIQQEGQFFQDYIQECEFFNNRFCIEVELVPESFLGVSRNLFAFNEICFDGLYYYYSYQNLFYKNDSIGSAEWLGCSLFWENGSDPPDPNRDRETSATFLYEDPLFCDTTLLSGISVSVFSPTLAENNVCGSNIGIVSVGCDCGNADMQMGINIADLTFLVAYLFQSGPAPAPIEAGETDGVLGVNVADVTYLVAYLFQDGSSPICP